MIRSSSLLLIALAAAIVPVSAAPVIQPGDSVAICGDSITEQRIYSVMMEDYLLMCGPTSRQAIAQFGWSGEQAPGFLARLGSDLYPFKPTVVTTCYGMNDGHYGPSSPGVTEPFRQAQAAIVASLKQHGVRTILLGSSKCVDSSSYRNDPAVAAVYNQTLGELAAIDKDLAAKEGLIYIPVFETTTATMQKAKAALGEKYVFGGADGIHPGPNGQLVMAYAFLKALGCDGAIGTISINLGLQQAEGSPGQQIISFKEGTAEIESSRYPFCFDGDPAQTGDQNAAAVLKYVPFNEDLNRYLLKVEGMTAAKAKVTWGSETKEFTADQLKNGINLAAEFLHNPFVDSFHKVDAAVQAQQANETKLVKGFLHSIPSYKEFIPKTAGKLDDVAADAVSEDRRLYQNAVALVVPVRHSLTVTPEP